ncbi:outer membrane efflux protein, putative [Minicystis rosea]|nr:outer membrane efflux protein, putative [Minicystis rosea]
MDRSFAMRGFVSAAIALGAFVTGARAEAGERVVADLPRILQLVERNHPNLAVSRAKVLHARAQLDEAHFAPFSQFKMTGGVAIAPSLRGNNVFSPNTDVSLSSSLAVAWRVGVEGVIPLWTFGKITNLWDAAGAYVKVQEADLEKERDAVRVDVRKAYFGLQLARDSQLLLKDVRDAINKAQATLQKSIDKDEGDPIDLLKLQTYGAELEVRESEAQRYVSVALAGLRFYTGVADLDIPDVPLQGPKHQLGHVTRYLSAAMVHRPEIAMARAGVTARSALVQLARAQLFPDIGIGLSASMSAAPAIADQINPYVVDPGNYFRYGAALVFQWKLDFLPGVARVRQAEAQLDEVRGQQRLALGGAAAEVEVAYAEVIDWQKRVDVYAKAVKTAKKWLVTVQQGIEVGAVAEKELLEPAKAYATNKFSQMNAVMELDMAMSRLAKATGWDAIAPDGT